MSISINIKVRSRSLMIIRDGPFYDIETRNMNLHSDRPHCPWSVSYLIEEAPSCPRMTGNFQEMELLDWMDGIKLKEASSGYTKLFGKKRANEPGKSPLFHHPGVA